MAAARTDSRHAPLRRDGCALPQRLSRSRRRGALSHAKALATGNVFTWISSTSQTRSVTGGCLHKPENRVWYFVVLNATSPQLIGNINGHIARPAFSRIEGDDADRILVLPFDQIPDQRRAVGSGFVSLTPGSTETAEVIEDQVDITTCMIRYKRRRTRHNATPLTNFARPPAICFSESTIINARRRVCDAAFANTGSPDSRAFRWPAPLCSFFVLVVAHERYCKRMRDQATGRRRWRQFPKGATHEFRKLGTGCCNTARRCQSKHRFL